jgi:hypothetical protein
MTQIDYREIIYRQIFKLDSMGRSYYQDLFNLVSLLINEDEREELALMIVKFRTMFDNDAGKLPTFFALENAFYEMRVYNRKFVKLRTENAFKKIFYSQIAENLNEIKNWCFQKLYDIQKSIRFSALYSGQN